MNRLVALSCSLLILALAHIASAQTCSPTGYGTLTAALINPTAVTGTVDATGCDIGVYFNGGEGVVKNAEIFGARSYGVFVNADAANATVDVLDSWIRNIGDYPFTGTQRGVAVYYRAFFTSTATGRIAGNTIELYQKGGIVANGPGTDVQIMDNTVVGLGPVAFIAQNGIQIGYGGNAAVMKNGVSGNSYTGTSTVSGGIIVVGGPGYGTCPDGTPCAYTNGVRIIQNRVENNDVGIFLTNLAADGSAPLTATNVKANNNTVSSDGLHNNYGGFGYQAAISDVGNNDKMIANTISGPGYDPAAYPSAYTVGIDADTSFTNRPKVHATK